MKEHFIGKDKDRSKYAWLSKMTTYSKGSESIGAWLASSFCERINLFANQVVTFGNTVTLLGDGEMETWKLVMSRMIRDFMVFEREH